MRWKTLVLASLTLMFLNHPLAAQNAEACGVCHRDLYKQWLKSPHARSWTSENFQAQLQKFGKEDFCGRCHAAGSIWKQINTRLSEGSMVTSAQGRPDYVPELVERTEFREELAEDGVTCVTCHHVEVVWQSGSGKDFLGPYHTEAGHGGQPVDAFQNFQVCGVCHGRQPSDYSSSGSARQAGYHHAGAFAYSFSSQADCAKCHMPQEEGQLVQLRVFKDLPARKMGEHTFGAKRYHELGSALDLELQRGTKTLKVTNASLGHPPRTNPETTYFFSVQRMSGGATAETQELEFESAGQLAPGQSLELPVPLQSWDGQVEVSLFRRGPGGFEEKIVSRTFAP